MDQAQDLVPWQQAAGSWQMSPSSSCHLKLLLKQVQDRCVNTCSGSADSLYQQIEIPPTLLLYLSFLASFFTLSYYLSPNFIHIPLNSFHRISLFISFSPFFKFSFFSSSSNLICFPFSSPNCTSLSKFLFSYSVHFANLDAKIHLDRPGCKILLVDFSSQNAVFQNRSEYPPDLLPVNTLQISLNGFPLKNNKLLSFFLLSGCDIPQYSHLSSLWRPSSWPWIRAWRPLASHH